MNFRSLLLLLVSSLFLSSCVIEGTRRYTLDRQPEDEIVLENVDVDRYTQKYPTDDGVYLHREQMVELVHRAPKFGKVSYHLWETGAIRYLVLDPDAEWLSTFELDVPEEKELKRVFITVISPEGKISRFGMDDLKVETDSRGTRTYRLAYPGIVRGSIVDEGYEMLSNPIETGEYHHSLPLTFDIPCERLNVRYVHPLGWKVSTAQDLAKETEWEDTYTTTRDKDRGIRIVAYNAVDIPPMRDEPYSPYRGERIHLLQASLHHARMANFSVSMLPDNWNNLGRSMRSYLLDGKSGETKRIREKAEEIVGEETDSVRMMEKILSWTWENLQYRTRVERDYDLIDALEEEGGRASEITILTGLMMESAGLDVEFLMGHSAFDPPVNDDVPAPGAYYLPGLRVTIGDSARYLFPSITNFPINQIPSFMQHQSAMVFGASSGIDIEELPETPLSRSVSTFNYEVTLDEEGLIRVVERRELQGEEAFLFRRQIEGLNEEALREEIEDLVLYEGGDVRFIDYEIENREKHEQPFALTMEYEIEGLATIMPDEAILRIGEIFSPSSSYARKVDVESRVNPIRIYNDEEIIKRVELQLPTGWMISTPLSDVSETTSLGNASVTYETSPGLLTATYTRRLTRAERPAEDFTDLLRLIGTGSKLKLETLVVTY